MYYCVSTKLQRHAMQLVKDIETIQTTQKRIGEMLKKLSLKGESVSDIVQIVRFLESQKVVVPTPEGTALFDVCGTGGTGKQRMNLSTALAVKLAKEFSIAKHGNKASSGRCGSFDIIERSSFPICKAPAQTQVELRRNNIAFLFAPAFHPVLGLLAPVRQSLSHPTIFNLVGPLLNPMSSLTAQLIGVKDIPTARKLAEVCAQLGKNALLVHDTVFGLDEVSIGGETHYFKVIDRNIEEGTFVPENFGIERVTDFALIRGGENLDENVHTFTSLIEGTATPAQEAFLEINYRVAKDFFSSFQK
jgi:anthranilate phosphoribosyltransferase